jgi:hypothetical protein
MGSNLRREEVEQVVKRDQGGPMTLYRERSVATNGLKMHVLEAGEGKPVVLLHGGTVTSASWAAVLPILLTATTSSLRTAGVTAGRSTRPAS